MGGKVWDIKFELYPDEASIFAIPGTSAATKSAPILFVTSPVEMDPLLELAMVTVLREVERVFRGT